MAAVRDQESRYKAAPPAGMTSAAWMAENHPGVGNCSSTMEEFADYRTGHLRRELEHFEHSGIIEVAVRNPQVAEYCKHWKGRTEIAEAELARLRQRVKEIEGK